jgi:chromosome segregation protein
MDALLFSLGELSTRRMRADNASRLIFHGSEKGGLEKSKMAKVVVQFDNTDGLMPVDTSTVTISREVYRNGQSVYRLNGRRMNRSHINETLSMSAISSMSQNIIHQGQITRLTEINPLTAEKSLKNSSASVNMTLKKLKQKKNFVLPTLASAPPWAESMKSKNALTTWNVNAINSCGTILFKRKLKSSKRLKFLTKSTS